MALYDAYGREIRAAEIPAGLDMYLNTVDIPSLSAWDLPTAKSAADSHIAGDFETSARMYWAMLEDPRVSDGINKHALAVRGLPSEIVPGKGQAAKTLARKWEEVRGFAIPDAAQCEIWSHTLLMGVGVGQIVWQYDEDGEINPRTGKPWYVPRIEPWEPMSLKVQRQWSTGRGSSRSQEQLLARVCGSVRDEDTFDDVPVVPGTGQWLRFSLSGVSRPWLFGKLRTIWRYWISRLNDVRWWLRFNEVHSLPIRAFKLPMGMRKTPESQAMYNSIKTIGNDATLLLPQQTDGKGGADVDFKEARSESWRSLQEQWNDYGKEITIDLTGGTQNTEAVGGNYKGAEEQREIRHEVKAAGGRAWQSCENDQLALPFAERNGYSREEAALAKYDVEQPTDEKADADADKAAGEALSAIAAAAQALRAAGYEIPVEELAASMGRPLPPGKRVAVQVPQGPAEDKPQPA